MLRVTLTADNLDSHAGMPMPLNGVKLDVASEHGVVQVVVLHRVRVHVTFEHLLAGNHRNTGKRQGVTPAYGKGRIRILSDNICNMPA